MSVDCVLVSGMPFSQRAAERLFENVSEGTFAAEWVRAEPNLSREELVKHYVYTMSRFWAETATGVAGLGIKLVPNAKISDLEVALSTHPVVVILAHHVETNLRESVGMEFTDGVISANDIRKIAPTFPSVVHLGVCRSLEAFPQPFKARCGSVRVLVSQGQAEPEFVLRTFVATVRLWRQLLCDYVEAYVRIRNAMLDSLGVAK